MYVTLHGDLADDLRARIVSAQLPVGTALPSEAKLAAQWGTSRGTVRQALAALRAEGLIGGGRGAPPVVRSRQVPQPFDALLSFTRWAHKTGRTPGQRTVSVSRTPADAVVADALGIDPGDHVVRVLRARSLDGEVAMLERATFPYEVGAVLLTADLDRTSIWELLTAAGLAPASATHVFDAVAADDVDGAELEIAVGEPLLRERRTSYLATGEVLEFSDDRYRPDRVTFTVVNAQATRPAIHRTWSLDAQRPTA